MVACGLSRRPQGLMYPNMLKALAGGRLFAVDDEILETKLQRIPGSAGARSRQCETPEQTPPEVPREHA